MGCTVQIGAEFVKRCQYDLTARSCLERTVSGNLAWATRVWRRRIKSGSCSVFADFVSIRHKSPVAIVRLHAA
jgi:hypothetical protein